MIVGGGRVWPFGNQRPEGARGKSPHLSAASVNGSFAGQNLQQRFAEGGIDQCIVEQNGRGLSLSLSLAMTGLGMFLQQAIGLILMGQCHGNGIHFRITGEVVHLHQGDGPTAAILLSGKNMSTMLALLERPRLAAEPSAAGKKAGQNLLQLRGGLAVENIFFIAIDLHHGDGGLSGFG